jgi:hypothetical protein
VLRPWPTDLADYTPGVVRRRLATLFLLALVGCRGPFLVFPGGGLSGPVQSTPESFAFARDAGTVQLETRPEEPYSVNIACAVVKDGLYVSAGGNKSRWVEHMESNPLVRLRIDGDIYELRARRVVGDAEMRAFADVWVAKGSWARDPTTLEEAWVYRLGPR